MTTAMATTYQRGVMHDTERCTYTRSRRHAPTSVGRRPGHRERMAREQRTTAYGRHRVYDMRASSVAYRTQYEIVPAQAFGARAQASCGRAASVNTRALTRHNRMSTRVQTRRGGGCRADVSSAPAGNEWVDERRCSDGGEGLMRAGERLR